MKWTNSYRSFGLKTKRSTGLKTIEHKHTAGLALVIAALAWILSHDGCSRPIGAVVAVLLLAVGGVCAFAPLLMLAASDAPWLFPEDSERE